LLLFWRGALGNLAAGDGAQVFPYIVSYYFLLIIAGAFLQVHIEESVAYYDIQEGQLAHHLIRPYPYLLSKFFTELPYRIIQAGFGLVVFVLLRIVYGQFVTVGISFTVILMSVAVTALGFWISFLFKMILGLSALWTTDFTGLSQLANVVILLAGGFLMPIDLFPAPTQAVLFVFPFPYMVYYPILSWLGRLGTGDLLRVMLIQVCWIAGFTLVYRILWVRGIRKFTAVGL
jgi:ABC-2 type transport system permease protein